MHLVCTRREGTGEQQGVFEASRSEVGRTVVAGQAQGTSEEGERVERVIGDVFDDSPVTLGVRGTQIPDARRERRPAI
jgi:hypothetical protein